MYIEKSLFLSDAQIIGTDVTEWRMNPKKEYAMSALRTHDNTPTLIRLSFFPEITFPFL